MPGPDASAPVLAYHRISRRPLLAGTWVAPAGLGAQLDALLGAGLRPLDADAWLAGTGGFLITFDDGTEDLLRHRALLESRGVPAVVFVPGDLLGRENRWEWPMPTRRTRHLDAAALRDLAGEGWEIGLHGGRHRDLIRCDDRELADELSGARRRLEDRLGRAVRLLAYPYGRTDARVAGAAGAAGFAAAFVMAAAPPEVPGRLAVVRRPVYCIDSPGAVLRKVRDPAGRTPAGRRELYKERLAHGVGRLTAGWLPRPRERRDG